MHGLNAEYVQSCAQSFLEEKLCQCTVFYVKILTMAT